MKIFVTGGAGFIGSNFIFYLLKNHPEDEIVCLDSLTYAGNLLTLKDILSLPKFRFVKVDIADRKAIFDLFEEEKPDVVVNFAAESHVDRSIASPEVFLRTNIMGTQVLLDACRAFKVSRFHQVSTDEVYGDLPLDLPVSLSRCSNNYGPYQFPEKLIPRMIFNALNGKPLPVYGDGKNVRDWLYVEDHCHAIDLIIRKGKVGEVYNIGGHNEKSNLEVVQTIIRAIGRGEITFVKDRAGHDRRYAIDPEKIHRELGWLPETPFAQGIEHTIRWYLNNTEWMENIFNGSYQTYYDRVFGKN